MSNDIRVPNAAEWRPDPSKHHEFRYHDGTSWTDHVSDSGVQAVDPFVTDEPADDEGGLRADIQAAKDRMSVRLGAGREIKKLAEHLWEDETVVAMTTGQYGGGVGLLVQTDRRLLFTKDGIGRKVNEDFPFERITSIKWTTGMTTGSVAIFVAGNQATITHVSKKDGKVIVDAVRASGGQPASPAPAAAVAVDPLDQLRKLAELRDAGVVSEEEFQAHKAKLLGTP